MCLFTHTHTQTYPRHTNARCCASRHRRSDIHENNSRLWLCENIPQYLNIYARPAKVEHKCIICKMLLLQWQNLECHAKHTLSLCLGIVCLVVRLVLEFTDCLQRTGVRLMECTNERIWRRVAVAFFVRSYREDIHVNMCHNCQEYAIFGTLFFCYPHC